MSHPKKVLLAGVLALAMLATACGRSGSDDSSSGASNAASSKCKDTTLEATEIGVTADSITVQVMADVGSPLAPGLFQGNVDATKAWARWVNENGGLACRQVKVEIWDSKLDPTEAKNGLINGCKVALALVGDNALFNPDTATIGNCPDKAGQAIGIPNFVGLANDANEACQPNTWNVQSVSEVCPSTLSGVRPFQGSAGYNQWLAKNLAPNREFYLIPGDFPTTVQSGMVIIEQQRKSGIDVVGSAKVSGRAEQSTYLAYLTEASNLGATTIYDGSNSTAMLKAQQEAKAQGVLAKYKWTGSLSIYDKTYTTADPSVTNGTYAGLNQLPWDEADRSEGLSAYIKYIGGAGNADALGANAFMAGIAFKETVDRIVAAKGPNALTRANIVKEIPNTKSDFGGWIGETKGGKDIMPCFMVIQIQNGVWKRIYPTETGKLDCSPANRLEVTLDPQAAAATAK